MTDIHRRLAAIERQLADALAREDELRTTLAELSRKVAVDRVRLTVLRQLLAGDYPEDDRIERDADRILDAISGPSRPTAARPALRVLEGAPAVDAASVQATAAADQSPPWAAHSDRVAGRARRAPGRDRHGLHTL